MGCARGDALRFLSGPTPMSQHSFAGFRPERGLPWFSSSMEGLSPEQIKAKCEGLLSFVFDNADMAPSFPKGTRVVLRPVTCRCKIAVGKVYVLLHGPKGAQRPVAVGRLTQAPETAFPGYGLDLTLTHDSTGAATLSGWHWPTPDSTLCALAYYGSVEVEQL
jgi:hypothetical protein